MEVNQKLIDHQGFSKHVVDGKEQFRFASDVSISGGGWSRMGVVGGRDGANPRIDVSTRWTTLPAEVCAPGPAVDVD